MAEMTTDTPPEEPAAAERVAEKRPADTADTTDDTNAENGSPEVKRPRRTGDAQMKQRSQRLFGVLVGTLNKFKADTGHKSEKEKQREELEKRLAEKLKKEKEEISEEVKKEREERAARIEEERKQTVAETSKQTKEFLRNQKIHLSTYIPTKTNPPIYYLPKNHTEKTLQIVAEQKRQLALESATDASRSQPESEEMTTEEPAAQVAAAVEPSAEEPTAEEPTAGEDTGTIKMDIDE
ncbi:pinin/SDK/memA/ protein conserved region-domain-containing protein [Gaertneriomyces semiglobifer]|nr:pinin/SDK/memA/ protein conserved region-domain-containing protein [Gaertneriomyces semiglobifer]